MMQRLSSRSLRIITFTIIVLCLSAAVYSVNKYSEWVMEVVPFSQVGWASDLHGGKQCLRLPMARYLTKNQTLVGLDESRVRTLLAFDQDKHCVEAQAEGCKLLIFFIGGRGPIVAQYTVYLKNGVVVKDKLYID